MKEQEHFDAILTTLKTGRWNLQTFATYALGSFLIPSLVLGGSFLSPSVDYLCAPDLTQEGPVRNIQKCSYEVDVNGTSDVIQCSKWNYNDTYFKNTLTSEFNLVCERDHLRALFHTMYMLGNFFGSPINGILSDKFGRKKIFYQGALIAFTTSLVSSVMPNFTVILILRFIMGLSHPGVVQSGYILCMELCEPKHRGLAGITLSLPWAVGTMWFGLLGYLVKDWRWLQRICAVPAGLIIILLFFVDESPRWLIIKGEHERALKILKLAAKKNKATLPSDEDLCIKMKEIQKSSISKVDESDILKNEGRKTCWGRTKRFLRYIYILYKTPEIRKRTFLMYTMFFVSSTVYYGIALNAVNFKLDPFMYMIVNGLMEFPAYSLSAPVVARFGRVPPTVISFFICGGTILALAFIPNEIKWLVITAAMTGKFFISSAYQILYLVSTEVFPTEIRLQGIGTSSFVSRIGSLIAPYVTDYLGPLFPWVPSVVFGLLSLLAGVAGIFVPETLSRHLPETIKELEEEALIRKRKKSQKAVEENDLEELA